jgi:hypothetical protein
MLVNLTEAQVEYLRCVLEEEAERAAGHIEWLGSEEATDEQDKEVQTVEARTAIAQAEAILGLLNGGAR